MSQNHKISAADDDEVNHAVLTKEITKKRQFLAEGTKINTTENEFKIISLSGWYYLPPCPQTEGAIQ